MKVNYSYTGTTEGTKPLCITTPQPGHIDTTRTRTSTASDEQEMNQKTERDGVIEQERIGKRTQKIEI